MTHADRPRDRIVAESARQTLLILGAGGDLTARLLFPGLGSLLASDSGRPLDLLCCSAAAASTGMTSTGAGGG
jgi:glucose-6-phosphate 1-dehydrogenase